MDSAHWRKTFKINLRAGFYLICVERHGSKINAPLDILCLTSHGVAKDADGLKHPAVSSNTHLVLTVCYVRGTARVLFFAFIIDHGLNPDNFLHVSRYKCFFLFRVRHDIVFFPACKIIHTLQVILAGDVFTVPCRIYLFILSKTSVLAIIVDY